MQNIIRAVKYLDNKTPGYARSLLISIDQTGNTIAGGNQGETVSGRVSYNAQKAASRMRPILGLLILGGCIIILLCIWPVLLLRKLVPFNS